MLVACILSFLHKGRGSRRRRAHVLVIEFVQYVQIVILDEIADDINGSIFLPVLPSIDCVETKRCWTVENRNYTSAVPAIDHKPFDRLRGVERRYSVQDILLSKYFDATCHEMCIPHTKNDKILRQQR